MKPINDEGYYVGPEMEWNVEDVEAIAAIEFGAEFSDEDLEYVLVETLRDNQYIQRVIKEAIQLNITIALRNGIIKKQ
jgi:hypothetical protein